MEHWITGTILCGGCNQEIKGSVMDSVQDFCPLIEIDDEIWEALKPKVETMSLAERGWITDDSNT
jgi:hypothetical protein